MNSYRNPAATWLGSPNFTPGRGGHDMSQPSWVVLHTMDASAEAANARFQQASQQASATYGVKLDGSLLQWVDEQDAAWANGATGRGGRGDNLDSISIEHEDDGNYNGPRTPQLYAASAALVREVCLRYGIPIDRQHIIGHRECDYAQTACPDALDVEGIVAAAAAGGKVVLGQDDVNAVASAVADQLNQGAIGQLVTELAQEVINAVQVKPTGLTARLAALAPAAGTLTAAQAQLLQDAHDAIARVEAALKGA